MVLNQDVWDEWSVEPSTVRRRRVKLRCPNVRARFENVGLRFGVRRCEGRPRTRRLARSRDEKVKSGHLPALESTVDYSPDGISLNEKASLCPPN